MAILEHWDRLYRESPHGLPWEVDFVPPELLTWARHLPAGARILDVGCGRGIHALTFAELGFSVTGIDISSVAIAAAIESAGKRGIDSVTFEVADIISYRTKSPFDFGFDYSVFHHIPEGGRCRYVESVYRALKLDALFGLVCYTDSDDDARGQRVRVGRYGNVIYHPTRDEVTALFRKWFEFVSYAETTLGRKNNHRAHHFLFRKSRSTP